MKSKTKIILITLLVALSALAFSRATVSKTPIGEANEAKIISITVIAGERNFQTLFPQGDSFYAALLLAKEKDLIDFRGKTFPTLGYYLSDIGDLHEGGGKYLIYYINGKESSVGVSLYKPEDGDVVLWKLE